MSDSKTSDHEDISALRLDLSCIEDHKFIYEIQEYGTVLSIKEGIAKVYGLGCVVCDEIVEFESSDDSKRIRGVVMELGDHVPILMLDPEREVFEGMRAFRTKQLYSTPVGEGLLGRVINALGEPIDGNGPIEFDRYDPVEKEAPGVMHRKSVHEPMLTGIKAIDALIPIGRGQRELVIGDRSTGKTTIALDTIINQKSYNQDPKNRLHCIYVAIGQKMSSIKSLVQKLEEAGAMEYTTIVSATAADCAILQYYAPYVGVTIGEYYRDRGQHALVVFDDLSKHAVAYREISLLLRRPPGREAYPGDVFYLHSRLLERAAKLSDEKGSGSLTAIPIIETQANDVSAYIPTNVISITDGQIFLESDLFNKGVMPAVNVGLSVSRVGSAAQTKAMKQVAGSIKLKLAQYREMQAFSKFGSDLDSQTRKELTEGGILSELLKQKQYSPLSLGLQIAVLFASGTGLLNDIPIAHITKFEFEFLDYAKFNMINIIDTIESEKALSDNTKSRLAESIKTFVEMFKDKAAVKH